MPADDAGQEAPKLGNVTEVAIDENMLLVDALETENRRFRKRGKPLLRFHDGGDVLHRPGGMSGPAAFSVASGV